MTGAVGIDHIAGLVDELEGVSPAEIARTLDIIIDVGHHIRTRAGSASNIVCRLVAQCDGAATGELGAIGKIEPGIVAGRIYLDLAVVNESPGEIGAGVIGGLIRASQRDRSQAAAIEGVVGAGRTLNDVTTGRGKSPAHNGGTLKSDVAARGLNRAAVIVELSTVKQKSAGVGGLEDTRVDEAATVCGDCSSVHRRCNNELFSAVGVDRTAVNELEGVTPAEIARTLDRIVDVGHHLRARVGITGNKVCRAIAQCDVAATGEMGTVGKVEPGIGAGRAEVQSSGVINAATVNNEPSTVLDIECVARIDFEIIDGSIVII